jgi:ABC-type transport system substrate-binding protein
MRTAGRRTCIPLAALSVLGPTWASAGTLPASAQQPAPVIPLLREGVVGSIPTATVTKDNFASCIDFTSCDTLMSYASDGRLVPDLATSVSQPNDVTYVYDIRHGVKFWDGSPLTATDVAFSLNLERAPGSPWAFFFPSVKSVTATSPYEVTVELIPAESLRTIASEGPIDALLKTINLYPHSVAKARQEMAASDYHNGASTTIVVWAPSAVDPAEVIVAELHQIGINARLQVLTFPQWLTEATGPPAKRPAMYTTWSVANSDPNSYMSLLGTANLVQGQFNVADYAPPGLDAQIKAGISTDNDPERFSAYATILKRLSLDVPYVGLFDGDAVVALSKAFSWPSYGPYSTEGFWPLGVTSATR